MSAGKFSGSKKAKKGSGDNSCNNVFFGLRVPLLHFQSALSFSLQNVGYKVSDPIADFFAIHFSRLLFCDPKYDRLRQISS